MIRKGISGDFIVLSQFHKIRKEVKRQGTRTLIKRREATGTLLERRKFRLEITKGDSSVRVRGEEVGDMDSSTSY